MSAQSVQDDQKGSPATVAPAPAEAATAKPAGAKAGLGAMPFDEAEARLKPPGGAEPVGAKPGAKPPKARKPPDPRRAAARRMKAYDDLRTAGANPAWMSAVQRALGVAETGLVNLEVIDAIIALQQGAGRKDGLGELDAKTLKVLTAKNPELATIPRNVKADKLKAGSSAETSKAGKGGADAPENESLGQPSYADYATKVLKNGTFLGFTVTAHPEFHARLANAEAYLEKKYSQSGTVLAKTLGVTKTSSFRASTASTDEMHHGTGFALDLNAGQNPWLFMKSDQSAIGYAMERAGVLFGDATIRSAADLSKNARKTDTGGAFDAMAQSNETFKRYRALVADPAQLKAWLESDKCPPEARKRGFDYWVTKGQIDEKNLAKNLKGASGDPDKAAGFMDLQKETVMALRDAGGLRWGGTDLGADSGDLMHFDGGTMGTADRLRKATKAVRRRRAADKEPAPKG